jgi:hypothetical protein
MVDDRRACVIKVALLVLPAVAVDTYFLIPRWGSRIFPLPYSDRCSASMPVPVIRVGPADDAGSEEAN